MKKKYVVAIFDKLSISSERGSLSPTFKTSRNSYDQHAHFFFFARDSLCEMSMHDRSI